MIEDLFDALGPRVAAEMGARRERVTPVLITGSPDEAAAEFAQQARTLCGNEGRVAVLQDARTALAAGHLCVQALGEVGLPPHAHTLSDADGHGPVCDDLTKQHLLAALPAFDLLVGVGSGVISDLAKWVAYERDRPAAVFATAASMNGYTAANVAPSIDGVKSLFVARAHRVVATSPEILARAPKRMTTAGLGDVIAKWVSTADWRMNQLLFGEPYSGAVASIIDEVERIYLERPEAIAAGDARAVSGVFRALVFSGCAMTLQGSSLPASGGEHLISHALDMRAHAEGVSHDLHGRQVGVATLFVAALYQYVLELAAPSWVTGPLPLDRTGWGVLADAVAPHHDKQGRRMAAACEQLRDPAVWERLRSTLAPTLPAPERIKHVLKEANAAHRIDHLGIDRDRFVWAVLNGAQMRERFTSLDLAWAAGVLPDAVDEIVDTWLL
ncbi:MAG: iron-containing alcohol dehydrogenase [Myxococcales bacterium]|nr:iron-containing alcohol dehydrogenase [Myxococcales bacterium]